MVNFGVVVFLKEREGDNLGDGKFSGIPNLKKKGRGREEEGKTHTHIKEMMARRRKFKTLGKIGNRETHNFGTLKKREAPGSAFSIYSRAFQHHRICSRLIQDREKFREKSPQPGIELTTTVRS